MSNEFVNDFVDQCINSGKNNPKDIILEAQSKIDELEEKIKQIELLRSQQNNYRSVIKHLGGGDVVRKAKRPVTVDTSVSEEDLPPYIRSLCVKICSFIENNKEDITPRMILDHCGSLQENKAAFVALKWLHDHGIVDRKTDGMARLVIVGPKWDERPTE